MIFAIHQHEETLEFSYVFSSRTSLPLSSHPIQRLSQALALGFLCHSLSYFSNCMLQRIDTIQIFLQISFSRFILRFKSLQCLLTTDKLNTSQIWVQQNLKPHSTFSTNLFTALTKQILQLFSKYGTFILDSCLSQGEIRDILCLFVVMHGR